MTDVGARCRAFWGRPEYRPSPGAQATHLYQPSDALLAGRLGLGGFDSLWTLCGPSDITRPGWVPLASMAGSRMARTCTSGSMAVPGQGVSARVRRMLG